MLSHTPNIFLADMSVTPIAVVWRTWLVSPFPVTRSPQHHTVLVPIIVVWLIRIPVGVNYLSIELAKKYFRISFIRAKISVEYNTLQRHIVFKQEKKG